MTIQRSLENSVYVVQCDETTDIDTRKERRDNASNRMHFLHHEEHCASYSGRGWVGASTQEITDILEHGWPEGQARVQAMADEMRGTLAAPKSYRRKQRWSEDGDEPSWEREQYGATDIWRTSRRDVMVGPTTVELLAPWVHNAFRRPSEIEWNGVVVAVLADLLEEAGYRVGITLTNSLGVSYPTPDCRYVLGLVTVKRPQDPLDMASLVPVCVHPGTYRWLGIAFATLAPVDCGSGHGRCTTVDALPPVSALPKEGIVLRAVYTEYDARAEIQRVLAMFSAGHPQEGR